MRTAHSLPCLAGAQFQPEGSLYHESGQSAETQNRAASRLPPQLLSHSCNWHRSRPASEYWTLGSTLLRCVLRVLFKNLSQNFAIPFSQFIKGAPGRIGRRNRICRHPTAVSILVEVRARLHLGIKVLHIKRWNSRNRDLAGSFGMIPLGATECCQGQKRHDGKGAKAGAPPR